MTSTGRVDVQRALRVIVHMAACTALCTLTVVGAPALATDREKLIGQLVPVTGENSRSVDLAVAFAKNAADLTDVAREQLDELGAALAGEKLASYDVGIYGHTDSSGPAEYNLKLSQARAKTVVHYLVERFGFEASRFRHEGYGEQRLLEGLDPNAAAHRRVEIVVFVPSPRNTDETDLLGYEADLFEADWSNRDRKERDGDDEEEGSGYQAIQ